MCHMLFAPRGKTPPREYLENATALHQHGAGHAVMSDAGYIISGAKADYSDVIIEDFLTWREAYPWGPALFHARYATDSNGLAYNVQPILTENWDTAVAHNGWLFPIPEGDIRSDTRIFTEEILPLWDLDDLAQFRQLEGLLGKNKLIILAADDSRYKHDHYLLNQDLGIWDNGIWYSNADYLGGVGVRQRAVNAGVCQICGSEQYNVGRHVPGASVCEECAAAAGHRRELLMRGPG